MKLNALKLNAHEKPELKAHAAKAKFGGEEHKMEAHKEPSFAGSTKAGLASKLDLKA